MEPSTRIDPPAPLRTASGAIDYDRYLARAHLERSRAVHGLFASAVAALSALAKGTVRRGMPRARAAARPRLA